MKSKKKKIKVNPIWFNVDHWTPEQKGELIGTLLKMSAEEQHSFFDQVLLESLKENK